MLFRLTNAPALFERFIKKVLHKVLHCFMVVYLDDILIFLENRNKHMEYVKEVLQELQKANIRLKLKKCEFHVQETEFLGYWISTRGIYMDQNKVITIRE